MKQDQETEPEDEKNSASLIWLIALIAGVLTVQFGMWYLITTNNITATDEQARFGDMFGAVNTLFSGLAFAGIIYTILLQRNELALQRKELRDTRTELKLTRKAHQKNCEIMDKQLAILEKTAAIEEGKYADAFLPNFVHTGGTPGTRKLEKGFHEYKFTITNIGREVKEAWISDYEYGDQIKIVDRTFPLIPRDGKIALGIKYRADEKSMNDFVWNFITVHNIHYKLPITIGIAEANTSSPELWFGVMTEYRVY